MKPIYIDANGTSYNSKDTLYALEQKYFNESSESNERNQLVTSDATNFAYNAVQNKGNRKAPPRQTKHEDIILPAKLRKKLVAEGRDQLRNYSVLAWMVRKHIAYISSFYFKVQTPDEELTKRLERHLNKAQKKENFDISKRHDLDRALALFEIAKVVEGDAMFIKLDNGKVQLVESDLIARPSDLPNELQDIVTQQGLVLDEHGAVLKFCLCRWDSNGKDIRFVKLLDAENVIYDGYFNRVSQTRGISPLTTALNPMKDLTESIEFNLLKQKAHALLGFCFYRDSEEGDGFTSTGQRTFDSDGDGAQFAETEYSIDMQGNILNLSLDAGDKVDLLESKQNYAGSNDFWQTVIRIALLALDIPYSLYDGRGSSFSHVKSDHAQYEKVCELKRKSNKEALQCWLNWKLKEWIAGDDILASLVADTYGDINDQFIFDDVIESIAIIPAALPWLDKKEQVETAVMQINYGLNSRTNVLKEMGLDAKQVVAELAAEEKLIREHGVTVVIGQPGQQTLNDVAAKEKAVEREGNSEAIAE